MGFVSFVGRRCLSVCLLLTAALLLASTLERNAASEAEQNRRDAEAERLSHYSYAVKTTSDGGQHWEHTTTQYDTPRAAITGAGGARARAAAQRKRKKFTDACCEAHLPCCTKGTLHHPQQPPQQQRARASAAAVRATAVPAAKAKAAVARAAAVAQRARSGVGSGAAAAKLPWQRLAVPLPVPPASIVFDAVSGTRATVRWAAAPHNRFRWELTGSVLQWRLCPLGSRWGRWCWC